MRTCKEAERSRISGVANVVLLCLVLAGILSSFPHHASEAHMAYIGPGAGFAFLGSFLTLIAGFVLGLVSFLSWPFRMLSRLLRRRKGFRHARVHKVIFLGLDGLDPRLTEKFMSAGKLPNLLRLKEQGAYSRLRTTFPALSPVAWSTFATGVNPAKHNIFDFLNRSLKTYVPQLSSAHVSKPRRMLRIGRWQIPLSRPGIEMRRKSQPFWKLLSDQNIGSTIIRVPITFPPDKFNGRQLSAMATPDLRGTQGSFSFFTTRLGEATYEGGSRYPLKRAGDHWEGELEGPENSLREDGGPLRIPFRIEKRREPICTLRIGKESAALQPGVYSRWIKLTFRAGPGFNIAGIARFLVTETEPEFSLYVSPVQIDPEKPALPVSHPSFYAAYLAKLFGTFSTLGMAEDTWALNEGVISEQNFLDQAYLLMDEREAMFRNAMEKTRRGVVACVFDTSDRIQHMFYRYLHSNGNSDGVSAGAFGGTIEDMYKKMDNLVGLASSYADEKTALFVLSDHGFCSFRRGINLNSWLRDNGYLALKDGASESGPYFRGVDWSRTKAYAVGLAGFYINLKGREAGGIVAPGEEAEKLKRELIERLANLVDSELNEVGIRTVYATSDLYKGPYAAEAPDMIVGYSDGYRTSWDAAVGQVTAQVFEDNCKAWSGDHCVDPMLVPGVFFSNRKVEANDPGIEDMAPTALSLFGLEPPRWMEGKPLRVDVA